MKDGLSVSKNSIQYSFVTMLKGVLDENIALAISFASFCPSSGVIRSMNFVISGWLILPVDGPGVSSWLVSEDPPAPDCHFIKRNGKPSYFIRTNFQV